MNHLNDNKAGVENFMLSHARKMIETHRDNLTDNEVPDCNKIIKVFVSLLREIAAHDDKETSPKIQQSPKGTDPK
jgi:hypothetical protein